MAAFAEPEDDEDEKDRSRRAQEERARLLAIAAMPKDNVTAGVQFASNVAKSGFASQGSAIKDVNAAIADEMDSRVAQEREARRMEHEKEIERMRLQAEQSKTDAMLARLQQENDKPPPGVISRIRIDGRGGRSYQ